MTGATENPVVLNIHSTVCVTENLQLSWQTCQINKSREQALRVQLKVKHAITDKPVFLVAASPGTMLLYDTHHVPQCVEELVL